VNDQERIEVLTYKKILLEPLLYTTVEEDAHVLCDEIVALVNELDSDYVLFTLLWEVLTAEGGTIEQFVSHLTRVTSQIKNKKCYFMFHPWYKTYTPMFKNIGATDILFFDVCLVKLYVDVVVEKKSEINKSWNPEATKFLFLTGLQHKIQRTRLLYKFYKSGLLKNAEWSWGLTDSGGKTFLNELSDHEYQEFIDSVLRRPDEYGPLGAGGGILNAHYGNSLYQDKLFEVISETLFDNLRMDNALISEKTWKSIINRLPFIIAGNQLSLKKLKNLGYFTFEEFMMIPNYDDPDSNTYLLRKDGLPHYRMPDSQWEKFYSAIADPAWPECKTHDDAMTLPHSIQQEIHQHLVIPIQNDTEMRLDAIIENTKHCLTTLAFNKDAIVPMLEHNYNQLIKSAQHDLDNINKFLDQHNIKISWDNLKF
jgi:hypothetical protein